MLQEGINLKIIKTTKFKTICIGILITQKLEKEYITFNAILPNLLPMGCEKYKTIRDINIKTEEMCGTTFYSDILKKGENQIIEFLIEFIEEKVSIEEILLFLKNIILEPLVENGGFKKEYFENAKTITIDNINARITDKKEFAKNRCIEKMCENENFGILADGYLQDFEGDKITNITLYNHYKNILETSEVNIIAIGNIDKSELENPLEKIFKIENRNYKPTEQTRYIKEKQEPKYIKEKFKITQGKLCIGFRTGIEPTSNQFVHLLVANEILGGSSGSKLFTNVREKESLCYYINSFVFMFKGIVFVQSGVDFKDYEKVVKYVENEIDNIKNGDFEQIDIETAKNSLFKKYNSILDYNTATMDYYLSNYLSNINLDINDILEKIKEVEKEDIKKAFENIWLDTCYFMEGDEN